MVGGLTELQKNQFAEYCHLLLASRGIKPTDFPTENGYFTPNELRHLPASFPFANVCGAQDPVAIYNAHFADGLVLLPTLERLFSLENDKDRVLDVVDIGSGGGFPGLVLAIARPHWRLTLVDSVRKKTDVC